MTRFLTTLLLTTLLAATAMAVAPTQEAIEKWKAEGVLGQIMEQRRAAMKLGMDQPNDRPVIDRRAIESRLAAGTQAADTLRVVVIMVEFSDNLMSGGSKVGTPAKFDSLLFSDLTLDTIVNPTGSMTDYYKEATYGQIYLQGDIFGPYLMPQPYSYYVGSDNGISKSPELVATAVSIGDAEINFADYARDGSHCDGLVIIHAGRGAEEGVYGIWSHKWNLNPSQTRDNVLLSNYTMNPEEAGTDLSPIGVFCHEYGHFLGLPDLYDVNDDTGTSFGLGSWSLMATGNYLGGSKKPAHFDPYCRELIGVINYTEVTANLHQAAIPDATTSPTVYRLRNGFTGLNEYWLVENRQKTGFDLNLPGAGLCIYHVDDAIGGNNHLPVYHVAMEQADGHLDLEYTVGNEGDAGDPFPGATNNRAFHDYSTPNSNTNEIAPSSIAVWNISNSGPIMYADLDIAPSRPYVQLSGGTPIVFNDDAPRGDGDGIPEAGETVQVYCQVNNVLRTTYNPRLTVTTNNPYVTFNTQTVTYGATLGFTPIVNATPVEFTVADSLIPVIDSFFLTITSDSLNSTPGSDEFASTFGVEKQVGASQVMIVDDDRGQTYESYYTNSFYKVRIPTEVWHVSASGLPTFPDMQQYAMVFWHVGRDTLAGDIDAARIALMKSYLDDGGNLMLTAMQGIRDIDNLDSAFMDTYFRATLGGSAFHPYIAGLSGSQIGNATQYRFRNDLQAGSAPSIPWLNVLSGGEACLKQWGSQDSVWGVSYNSGTYKTILLTFPAEFINSDLALPWAPLDTLIDRAMNYFGGIPTSIYDGAPFTVLPRSFDLVQNYPNPFNPTTTIQYTLRATGATGYKTPHTRLVVYNALGQEVKTLVDKVQIPGTYTVEWDGRNDAGSKVASGIYFYRLDRGDEAQTKKMVLLK